MNTSYFANISNVKTPVSISRFSPKWYIGPEFKELAPSTRLLLDYKSEIINDDEYVRRFSREFAKLDPQTVYKTLISLYGDDVTLLCYEKPGDFCHRHIVSGWLSSHNGIHISELELPNPVIKGVIW